MASVGVCTSCACVCVPEDLISTRRQRKNFPTAKGMQWKKKLWKRVNRPKRQKVKVKAIRKTSDQADDDKVDDAEIDDIRERDTIYTLYIWLLDLRSVERISHKFSLSLLYYFLCQLVLSLYPLINFCLILFPSLSLLLACLLVTI